MSGSRAQLHRPDRRCDAANGQQVERDPDRGPGGRARGAGQRGHTDGRGHGARRRRVDRLPGHAQGGSWRRRQGHSAGGQGGGLPGSVRADSRRGGERLRQRGLLSREVRRVPAPCGGAGALRPARDGAGAGPARLQRTAEQPEADRGVGVDGAAGGAARRELPLRGGDRGGDRLCRRGHRGVHLRPRGPEALLHGDEHAASGRAPGDRGGQRHGHRQGPVRDCRRGEDLRGAFRGGRLRDGGPDQRGARFPLGGRDRSAALARDGDALRLPAARGHRRAGGDRYGRRRVALLRQPGRAGRLPRQGSRRHDRSSHLLS